MLRSETTVPKQHAPSFFDRLLRKVDGCDVQIVLENKSQNEKVRIDDMHNKLSEEMFLYAGNEPVKGAAVLTPTGTQYVHQGVSIELICILFTRSDVEERTELLRQEQHYESGALFQSTHYDFNFTINKDVESYRGIGIKVAYYIRVVIRRSVKNITMKEEIWVTQVDEELSRTQTDASLHRSYFRETVFGKESTSMDVGVDAVLHIEFKFDKRIFHLSERVLGIVIFKLADLDIQFGEISIVRKEFIGCDRANNNPSEVETLQKFEIMDGTPITGEVVPIRLYLGSIPRLTPTMANVHEKFSVRYFLNLVLLTFDGKRYFKQQEITLYRRHGQEAPIQTKVNEML